MSTTNTRTRHHVLGIVAVSLFAALFTRLWYLQVITTDDYSLSSSSDRTQEVITEAPRGRILDRNGNPVVENRRTIRVTVDYQEFVDLDAPAQSELLRGLARELNADQTMRFDGERTENDPGAPPAPAGEGTAPPVAAGEGTSPPTTAPPARAPAGVATGAQNPTGEAAVTAERPPEVTVATLRDRLDDPRYSKFEPIPVATDVSEQLEIFLRENREQFPTVTAERVTVRQYVYGALLAHVLGYVGSVDEADLDELQNDEKPYAQDDQVGKTGIERGLERHLRGTPGRTVYEVDARNRPVREITERRRLPRAGNDVHLTIDINLQFMVEKALAAEIERRRGLSSSGCSTTPTCNPDAGAAVAVDPRDGQVLAMASYPTFDPDIFTGGISGRDYDAIAAKGRVDEHHNPLTNRAISGQYAPGSTFKLFSAYAGLATQMITPEYVYQDTGTYNFGCGGPGCTKQNAGAAASGPVDLARAIAVSSDTYFYKLANESWEDRARIGDEGLQVEMERWGLGTETGIGLPGEQPGRIPTPAWRQEFAEDPTARRDNGSWTGGHSGNMIIGQGDVLVTPLQLANGYAAFGNGGTVYLPQLVYQVTRPGSRTLVAPFTAEELGRVPIRPEWRESMLRGFEGATKDAELGRGTAARAFESLDQATFGVAGKTGTAQSTGRNDSSLFVAFAPSRAPTIAIASIVEFGGFGADTSVPIVRRVLGPVAAIGGDLTALNALDSPYRAPVGGWFDVAEAMEEYTPATGERQD